MRPRSIPGLFCYALASLKITRRIPNNLFFFIFDVLLLLAQTSNLQDDILPDETLHLLFPIPLLMEHTIINEDNYLDLLFYLICRIIRTKRDIINILRWAVPPPSSPARHLPRTQKREALAAAARAAAAAAALARAFHRQLREPPPNKMLRHYLKCDPSASPVLQPLTPMEQIRALHRLSALLHRRWIARNRKYAAWCLAWLRRKLRGDSQDGLWLLVPPRGSRLEQSFAHHRLARAVLLARRTSV